MQMKCPHFIYSPSELPSSSARKWFWDMVGCEVSIRCTLHFPGKWRTHLKSLLNYGRLRCAAGTQSALKCGLRRVHPELGQITSGHWCNQTSNAPSVVHALHIATQLLRTFPLESYWLYSKSRLRAGTQMGLGTGGHDPPPPRFMVTRSDPLSVSKNGNISK